MEVILYDATLREGAQKEGISFSVEDKLKIALKLDELGIRYIEGGYSGANPKDVEFFSRVKASGGINNARIAAFGSTRRANIPAEEDPTLKALLAAETEVVTLVGKSSLPQVREVLQTTPGENLHMIADSVRFMKSKGKEVIYDAEHFFDGFKADSTYALSTLAVAESAGADTIVLCDTNGGTLTSELVSIIGEVKARVTRPLGIHAHNDSGVAAANTLAAVEQGVLHVQGTMNGYGERCGNANLCTIIPNLKLKMDIDCVSDQQLARLTEVSHYISELTGQRQDSFAPYVGHSAFAHKGGLHADAVMKWEDSYQHVSPTAVGNSKRILVSELAGGSSVLFKARELGFQLLRRGQAVRHVLQRVKTLEHQGFQFEGAEGSLELLIRRSQPDYQPPFRLLDFLVLVEKRGETDILAEATVKVQVGDEIMHMAAEGNGPVNALDAALRKALTPSYPSLERIRLTDYKVRILDETTGTAARTRVLIESSDGKRTWGTVGSSTNIIEASWFALADSLEYGLLKNELQGQAEDSIDD